ncbi:DUF262 domain-containing protein [Microbacterium sp.]|uniref:DUF262 domain-containing protein n=1 Tax=Microbacterium sp. TaxID=51671 RepID=UPI0028A8A720|nr:DUF262 domain-containing protein [Microbacterium sp.]
MQSDESSLAEEVGGDQYYDDLEKAEASVPLDLEGERKLVTQPYDYSIRQLVGEIESGGIRLDVEYQRKYVWDDGKASRLIESLLLNVPIPVVYVAEDEDFSFEVIDGLQRLTTLRRYLADEFALTGVTVLEEIRGKRYSELAPRDQRRLSNRTIRCIAITMDSHPDIKFDVFERLNTNVAVLTAQEIRNCVYRGDFNESLKRLGEYGPLNDLVGSSGRRRMVPAELVLRFFSLLDGLDSYRPPLSQFVNRYMRERRHRPLSVDEIALFKSCVDTAVSRFGPKAFQVPDRNGVMHNTVHKALFDAVMICLATCDRTAVACLDGIDALISDLIAHGELRDTLGRATADRKRVFARIRVVGLAFEALGIDVGALDVVGRAPADK